MKVWYTWQLWINLVECKNRSTSGIPGGYRLVSTYDLPGCKTILRFEIWSFSNFWGGILKLSDLESLTIFIGGVFWNSQIWTLWQFSFGGVFWNSQIWTLWQFSFGGYSETLGFGLSDNFHWGGILKLSDLDSLTIFILGGRRGILKLLDLDSLTIFILGGVSETLGFGLSDNFHLGGYSETLWQFSFGGYSVLQNRGILSEFGPKFQPLQQAHASQIVSHILRMWRLTRPVKYNNFRNVYWFQAEYEITANTYKSVSHGILSKVQKENTPVPPEGWKICKQLSGTFENIAFRSHLSKIK